MFIKYVNVGANLLFRFFAMKRYRSAGVLGRTLGR